MFSSSMKRGLRGGRGSGGEVTRRHSGAGVDVGRDLSIEAWNSLPDATRIRGMRDYSAPSGYKFVEDGSVVRSSY